MMAFSGAVRMSLKEQHEPSRSFRHHELACPCVLRRIQSRDRLGTAGRIEMGRFHEKPVGPHPMWSCQLAFPAGNLAHVVSWLALNHGSLDVLVHPNTDDELRDHRDSALWLGQSHSLNLAALAG